jgi:5-methylcytosine-specific restriction endonuclease McrA
MSDLPIISRKDAKAAGQKRYFNGSDEPCKRGHVAERFVSGKQCVECAAEYRAANKEKIKAQKAVYREANKCAVKARSAKYREANRDEIKARSVEYRKANPGAVKAQRTEYRKAKPESVRAWGINQRARRLSADGLVTATDIKRIHVEHNGMCGCCGIHAGKSYHIDHIIPPSLGGGNLPENIQVLCQSCNSGKGAKHPAVFCLRYFEQNGVWPLFAAKWGWDRLEEAA